MGIKPHNDSFDKMLERMKTFAMNLVSGKGMKIEFDIPGNIPGVTAGMEFRKNLFLVFKEAVNNCAKYSEAENVSIHFRFDNGRLEMEIKDDGKGFDESKLERINGISNMRDRAMELDGEFNLSSKPGEGTVVRLVAAFNGKKA